MSEADQFVPLSLAVLTVSDSRMQANDTSGKYLADALTTAGHHLMGELRRGVELIRHRGDTFQAQLLEKWLESVLAGFADNILAIDSEIAQLWGRLCAPRAENSLDKVIAATALIHGLAVVTRNTRHFAMAGVQVLDPFSAATRGGRPAP